MIVAVCSPGNSSYRFSIDLLSLSDICWNGMLLRSLNSLTYGSPIVNSKRYIPKIIMIIFHIQQCEDKATTIINEEKLLEVFVCLLWGVRISRYFSWAWFRNTCKTGNRHYVCDYKINNKR